MVASVARICYEELQVVATELPENLSCVEVQEWRRPTHYTGQSAQDWGTGLLFQLDRCTGDQSISFTRRVITIAITRMPSTSSTFLFYRRLDRLGPMS